MFIRLGSRLPSASNQAPEDQGIWNANRVDGIPVDTAGLVAGQGLIFDGTSLVARAVILADGSIPMSGDLSLGGNDMTNVLTATGTGDLDFGGGYRQTFEGWFQNGTPAASGPTQLALFGSGTAFPNVVIFPRAGSVTGVWVKTDDPRTAGSLTVEVYKNGVATGLTAVLDGTNTTFKATTQAKDLDTFVAGDELGIRVTTDAGWTPVTANIRAGLEVET